MNQRVQAIFGDANPGCADLRAFARPAGIALALALLLYVAMTWRDFGISNDEGVQHVYGRLLLSFYASGLTDRLAFSFSNLYLYGGLFDLLAALLERLIPVSVWDLRHLLSALFGLAGILGTWKLARLLAGESAALLAALILALTGPWSAGMFTHTKDVPFGACMVWALYYNTLLLSELPKIRHTTVLKLGAALGLAFGLRVGAVFAVLVTLLSLLVAAIMAGGGAGAVARRLLGWLLALLPGAALAVVLMGLFWPWSVMGLDHLYLAVTTFSHFSFDLTTVLDGVRIKEGEVPRDYLHEYLLVRLPELMLIGLLLAVGGRPWRSGAIELATERRAAPRRARPVHLPLVLAITVPLLYAWLDRPALYNGIRHFLFLLPPLAVAAALGWRMLWQAVAHRPLAACAIVLAAGALALAHACTLAALHPYGYVYYNSLTGGLKGAAGRWELDYWSATAREGAEFLNRLVARDGTLAADGPPIPVAVCAEPLQAAAWLSPRLRVTTDWTSADFFISTTHMGCDKAMHGTTVLSIERDGVPLGVVLDRRGLPDHLRAPK